MCFFKQMRIFTKLGIEICNYFVYNDSMTVVKNTKQAVEGAALPERSMNNHVHS